MKQTSWIGYIIAATNEQGKTVYYSDNGITQYKESVREAKQFHPDALKEPIGWLGSQGIEDVSFGPGPNPNLRWVKVELSFKDEVPQ